MVRQHDHGALGTNLRKPSAASLPLTAYRFKSVMEKSSASSDRRIGESTLFNYVLGQLQPSAGEVRIDDKLTTGMRPSTSIGSA